MIEGVETIAPASTGTCRACDVPGLCPRCGRGLHVRTPSGLSSEIAFACGCGRFALDMATLVSASAPSQIEGFMWALWGAAGVEFFADLAGPRGAA